VERSGAALAAHVAVAHVAIVRRAAACEAGSSGHVGNGARRGARRRRRPPYPETQAAYAYAGVSIPRTSEAQFAYGPQVSLDAIAPRDLSFIAGSDGTAAAPGHVGIYLGAGQALQMIAALANQLTGPSGGGGPVPVNDPVAAKAIEFAAANSDCPTSGRCWPPPTPGRSSTSKRSGPIWSARLVPRP